MTFHQNLSSPTTTSTSSTSSPIVNTYNERMIPLTYTPTVTYYPNQYQQDSEYNEKRSAHNALERQRREGLNNKFQELAHVLPSLRQVRRPSKSMIVAKSLEFVSSANERESTYQNQIQALRKENEQLMRQAQLSKKRLKKKKKVEIDNETQQSEVKKRSREPYEEAEAQQEVIDAHMDKKQKQAQFTTSQKKLSASTSTSKKSSSDAIMKAASQLPVIMPSKSLPLASKKNVQSTNQPPVMKTTSTPLLNGQSTSEKSALITHQQPIVRTQQPLSLDQHELDLIQTYIDSISSNQDNDILDSFIQNDQFFQWH